MHFKVYLEIRVHSRVLCTFAKILDEQQVWLKSQTCWMEQVSDVLKTAGDALGTLLLCPKNLRHQSSQEGIITYLEKRIIDTFCFTLLLDLG